MAGSGGGGVHGRIDRSEIFRGELTIGRHVHGRIDRSEIPHCP